MSLAHLIVTGVAIVATMSVAIADLVRADFVVANSKEVGVPPSWLTPLGLLKAAGAVGLLLGLVGVPIVGVAAAIGLVLFFIGAVATHVRARNGGFAFPVGFLVMAVASLALDVAS